jgi:thiamine-phosphate pyrophosphorylase
MAAPQFTLITPEVAAPDGFRASLQAALAALPFAAVLIRAAGDDALTRAGKALVPIVQKAGAAAILHEPSDARLVARVGADGAHYGHGSNTLTAAIETLKPSRIVGVGGLKTRHEAMEAGERDIDYVMFGEPRADGTLPEFDRVLERAQWWADIFNTPCVAYAPALAAIPAIAATGAEFIALGPWTFESADMALTLSEARRLATQPMAKT